VAAGKVAVVTVAVVTEVAATAVVEKVEVVMGVGKTYPFWTPQLQ